MTELTLLKILLSVMTFIIVGMFVLNIARERAELLASRRPEGWEETSDSAVLCWERASAVAGCFVGGSKHYIWTEGDIPLEVLVAFCARAKEWKR